MGVYEARIAWSRGDQPFLDKRYSRLHRWTFDGGQIVPGSSAPAGVPVPMSDPSAVDPEEAMIASLSSCHMLWFLTMAVKRKFRVDRYFDAATGVMEKNAEGKVAMTVVTLHPEVTFSGERQPSREELDKLHHDAHEACFIANSVKTEVRCEPVYGDA